MSFVQNIPESSNVLWKTRRNKTNCRTSSLLLKNDCIHQISYVGARAQLSHNNKEAVQRRSELIHSLLPNNIRNCQGLVIDLTYEVIRSAPRELFRRIAPKVNESLSVPASPSNCSNSCPGGSGSDLWPEVFGARCIHKVDCSCRLHHTWRCSQAFSPKNGPFGKIEWELLGREWREGRLSDTRCQRWLIALAYRIRIEGLRAKTNGSLSSIYKTLTC